MLDPNQFQLFGPVHFSTLAIIFGTAALLVILARLKPTKHLIKLIKIFLASLLLLNEMVFLIVLIKTGQWNYTWSLSLNLCDLTFFAVLFSLISQRQWVWEAAYFWAMGGSLQALLSPDLIETFPSYIFVKFYLTHGLILIGVIFLAAGCGRMIYRASLIRVFWLTNIVCAFVGMFNLVFNTNYSYLCGKPSQPSLLDYLGPWPYYLLSLEGILVVFLLIYFMPYFIFEKMRK